MSDAGAAAAAAAGTGTSWFGGYDADTQAHITARGWEKLPADQALAQAVKAHREAERLIGRPAESLVVWPKDANDKEAWAKVRERMGVPSDPKEYDFAGLKRANGEDVKPEFVEQVRAIVAARHLSKDDAKALAADLVKADDAREQAATTVYTEKLQAERDALKQNWGVANYDGNMIVAQNAAAKLGITQEEVSALEKTTSYSRVMEMFRQIGERMGEAKFVRKEGSGGTGTMTTEEAQATLNAKLKDNAWVEKYEKGDEEAVAQFNNLTRLVAAGKRK